MNMDLYLNTQWSLPPGGGTRPGGRVAGVGGVGRRGEPPDHRRRTKAFAAGAGQSPSGYVSASQNNNPSPIEEGLPVHL